MSPTILQLIFGSLMLLTYGLIAFGILHKTVAALSGALVLAALAVFLGVIPEYDKIHELLGHDLNVLGVIIGTSLLVDLAGQSGLFHFLAIKVVKKTGGDPVRLFLALQLFTFGLTAVLTIVPAMLIVSGLVLVICRNLRLPLTPYLLGIAFSSNAAAFCTFASGLPTLMIGSAAKIPYVQFLQVSLPFALVSLVVCYLFTRRFFRKDLRAPSDPEEKKILQETVEAFDEWALAPDRGAFIRAATILALTILGFAFAGVLHLGLDFIAFGGGVLMLLFHGKSVEKTIAKVNWTVILFFTGLFVIVGLVKEVHLLDRIASSLTSMTGQSVPLAVTIFTWFSGIASAIVDNIPVAATMIPMVPGMEGIPHEPLWWSLILGSNLGGSATPIGSISCVIALHALDHEAGIKLGWGTFLAVGGVLTLIQLTLACLYLIGLFSLGLMPPLS